jgi:hypothetical protein
LTEPPGPVNGVYNVEIQGVTLAALPACTSAMAGQTAFVASAPSLYWCNGTAWVALP